MGPTDYIKGHFLTQEVIVQLFFLKSKLEKLSPEIFFSILNARDISFHKA